ncbi:MAG: hypothetical protein NT086_12400 [Proteobacteria bacterium]|nr:hypothetical protein [Pseudomonadota bacterium]
MDKATLTRLVLALGLLIGLLAGCATTTAVSQGRYLQFYYPAYNNLVGAQVAFPSNELCTGAINNIQTDRSFYRCTDESASSSLNYRAGFKSITSAVAIEIEALSLQECNAHIQTAISRRLIKEEDIKVLAPCAEKS